MRRALALALFAAACTGDVDAQWQLDHNRIIAVRATPPHIPAGATSTIDVFMGYVGSDVAVVAPDSVAVQSPTSLTTIVSGATVTAPSATTLAQLRSDMGLSGSDPVPLEVEIEAGGFEALKTIYMGDSSDNPTLDMLMVNGQTPPAGSSATIVVPANVDVPLFVNADDTVDNINWLTSCGTMNDFDLHDAFLQVQPSDPQSGQLAVVLRDESAGVVWAYWSITAEGSGSAQ